MKSIWESIHIEDRLNFDSTCSESILKSQFKIKNSRTDINNNSSPISIHICPSLILFI